MERETKTFTTPAGKKLVVLAKLNAGERNEVRRVFHQNVEVGAEIIPGQQVNPNIKKVDLVFVEKQEHALIAVAVKEYADLTTGILEALLQADPDEYDFAVKKAEETLSQNLNFSQAK